ncbi:MAG: hypothetical protein K9G76_00605 [Bacteroidales bacterium]|nr:hypothetical protein [Bacteroidales bacterium]MCF8402613.1 hypothetical protein [Bacteroidales bacterium]
MKHDKRNIIYLIAWNLLLISLIILINGNAFGQYNKPPTFFSKLIKNWSISANVGRTSFFGDVSLYDEQFNEKMSKEGAYGTCFSISRQFTPIIGLSGQILFGQLSGSNSKSQFVSNIVEYSGNMTINLVNLFIPENSARFSPYFIFGLGQFSYDTKLKFNDLNTPDITAASKSPELVYLFGGGAYYIINNAFDVYTEFSGRRMDNDRIDGSTSNSKDNDYYSYLSIGLSYKLNNSPRDTRYYKRMGMKSPLIRRR